MGKVMVSPSISVSTGDPRAWTSRPASVLAAWIVTCWPRTARTAVSKASKQPGTRMPGMNGPSADSSMLVSARATVSGSQWRSNRFLIPSSTAGSAGSREAETVTASRLCSASLPTVTQPVRSRLEERRRIVLA